MNAIAPKPTVRPAAPQTLQQVLSNAALAGLGQVSPMAGCLLPLLNALKWRGNSVDVAEALPHHVEDLSVSAFRDTLAHLGFQSQSITISLNKLQARLCPCLFVPADGTPFVILEQNGADLVVFDPVQQKVDRTKPERIAGEAYVFRPLETKTTVRRSADAQRSWFAGLTQRFRGQFRHLLAVSLALNVLALAVPLFILALYDQVIPTGAIPTLVALTVGVMFALGYEMAFRVIRSNALAHLGGRVDFLVGSAVFRRLLNLPPAQTESAPLGAQISRLRELHAVRSAFTGPLCIALLDLPFVLLFLLVIFLVGGWLAMVPIATIVLMVGLAVPFRWRLRKLIDSGTRANADHQAFLVETASKVRAIKYHCMEDIWARRHREISARSATASYTLGQFASRIEIFADIIKLASGTATLAVGILLVLDGAITVGALIASMALLWRALSPLQTLFLSAIKLEQTRRSIESINGLMHLPSERTSRVQGTRRSYSGRLGMRHVGFRFRPDRDPAVHNISLDVSPGEIVALAGPSGAGKSTILKLILGMYTPQAGAVLIDGLDLRQLDRIQFRQSVAYMPQSYQLFHGTIAQNLRLSFPAATMADLERAAAEAMALEEIQALPDGFETWLDSERLKHMPNGLRQRFCLARAFVRPSRIVLLDEPGTGLDARGDEALCQAIAQRRGKSTVIVGTHRPSHMRLADKVIYIDRGQILASGSPDEVLPQLMRARS